MSKDLIYSIDVETTGSNLEQNELVAYGYCVGDFEGNVLEKGRFSFEFDEKKCEPRCMEEYWSRPLQKEQLKQFKEDALDPKVAMEKVVQTLDKYEKDNNVTILTDNPAFDIAYTNIYLNRYTKRPILQYSVRKVCDSKCDGDSEISYRGVYDILELAIEHSPKKFIFNAHKIKTAIDEISSGQGPKHDHWPENDAEYNYRKCLAIITQNNKNDTNKANTTNTNEHKT